MDEGPTSMFEVEAEGRAAVERYQAQRLETLRWLRQAAIAAGMVWDDMLVDDVDKQLIVLGYRMQRRTVALARQLHELLASLERAREAGIRLDGYGREDVAELMRLRQLVFHAEATARIDPPHSAAGGSVRAPERHLHAVPDPA